MQRQDIGDKTVNYPNGYPAYHARTESVIIFFFSTHKMCWWLVISVSQFLQDLSKYRDALHGRKVFFMIQVSSPAFTLTQFNSWSVLISFCSFFLYHNFRLSNIVLLLKTFTFCVCDTGYKFQDIQLFIIVQCFFFRHNQCG